MHDDPVVFRLSLRRVIIGLTVAGVLAGMVSASSLAAGAAALAWRFAVLHGRPIANRLLGALDLPPFPDPYWAQPAWFLDPENTSGCASDSNTCTQSTCGAAGSNQGPCVHYSAAVARRWTGYSPQANVDVKFTLMSAQPDNTDPIIFRPVQLPVNAASTTGNTYLFQCTKSLATTTTISTLTAKVPSTNTQFVVTFGTAPTRGQMIQNVTHPSIAWIGRANAATHLTQPCSLSTSLGTGTPVSVCGEINTWTVGDTVQFYNLPAWTFSDVEPTQVGMAGETVVIIQNCFIQQQASAGVGPGDDLFRIGNGVQLVEDFVEKSVVRDEPVTQYTSNSSIINSSLVGGFYGGQLSQTVESSAARSSPFIIAAGLVSSQNNTGIGSSAFTNVDLMRGVMIRNVAGFPIYVQGYNFGHEVQLADATTQLEVVGVLDLQNTSSAFEAGQLWGLGKVDANPGKVYYSIATTAAASLPVTTLEISGGTNACCATIANPSVVNCSIALTTTTLAAGACSSATPALGNAGFLPWGGAFVGF